MNLEKFQSVLLEDQISTRKECENNQNLGYDVKNCKIICFYAEKGGVCKTTNTTHLAFTFAEQGKRVLIYDCDTQRSLTAEMLGLELINFHESPSPLTDLIESKELKNGFQRTL